MKNDSDIEQKLAAGEEVVIAQEESVRRKPKGIEGKLIAVIAISFSLFQLITGYFPLIAMYQRIIHLIFGFSLIYLLFPFSPKQRKDRLSWDGYLFVGLILYISYYVWTHFIARAGTVGLETPLYELIIGGTLIVLSLEASRRTTGWAVPLFCIGSLIYARFGEWLPVVLGHPNYSVERIISGLFMTTEGIYGSLTGIAATFIFLFILFGTFMQESGAGNFFFGLASSLFGHVRGGPAKIAVVASSLFGMISGSALANVSASGQITIPMMKRAGYKPHFAGAVESASSVGGQFMPPVMGGSVFIMMEVLGVSYVSICKAAFLSAILYYVAIFFIVDFEAVKCNLKGQPKSECPKFREVFKQGFHFIIPPAVLVYLLMYAHVTETRAAFWAIISVPLASFLRKSTRMGPRKILRALERGALGFLPIVGIVVACNILVGMITLTGLGLQLSSILIELSGNSLFLLLFLTMIASLILGLGLPIIVSYLVLAVLVAPALTQMGVDPLAAHLFIFFFALVSDLTPPVAPGPFVAAGIAGAEMMRTAWMACRLGLVVYILPYMFVYNNALLLKGDLQDIILSTITAFIGVYALACGIQGCMLRPTRIHERILFFGAALALIKPGWISDLVGLAILVSLLFMQKPTFPIDLAKRLKAIKILSRKLRAISEAGKDPLDP
ncbi:MAG: TRAP transporter permease [Thermodesulfobacteriota bacterium]|nr:TRAP transporter permease [Thermodesulfobacteriota bacterium]